jgi:hypothetical protein
MRGPAKGGKSPRLLSGDVMPEVLGLSQRLINLRWRSTSGGNADVGGMSRYSKEPPASAGGVSLDKFKEILFFQYFYSQLFCFVKLGTGLTAADQVIGFL